MTALVTKHLPLVAGAPDGIKKLRALILDLAVRGWLVPQNSEEASASELIAQMQAEQARLLSRGNIRRVKKSDPVDPKEFPFEVPHSWQWVRLASIGHDLGQAEPSADFTYIDVGSVNNRTGIVQSPQVLSASEAPSRARKVVRSGSVIYSTIRPYLLNVAVIDQDFCPPPIASTAFAIIQPYPGLLARYLFWWLRSETFIKYVESVQTGIAYPAINDGQFFNGLIPIPPFEEQERIVAKVDELMALCDRLEADQADAQAAHAQLVQALLDSLTQATDAADFRASWQRLSEHFHTLFTTEASIDALKQTVLQLAVMGKLVKQNPEDEWASELLKRVALERTRLLEEGGSRKQKSSAKFADEDRPFDLPLGWAWVRLGDYCLTQTGTTPNKSQHDLFGSHVPFIKPGDIYTSWVKYDGEGLSALGVSQSGRIARAGSLLMVCIGTIGKCNLIDRGCSFNQQINSATLYEGLPKYLLIALRSRYFQDQAWGNSSSTTIAILNKGKWESIPIPLPGITEQHRIVAKVDELMALCDQLKGYLAESRQQHAQLATVLVEQAVA